MNRSFWKTVCAFVAAIGPLATIFSATIAATDASDESGKLRSFWAIMAACSMSPSLRSVSESFTSAAICLSRSPVCS